MLDIAHGDAQAIASAWLAGFERCLSEQSTSGLNALFLDECYWRDALALTWNLETLEGRASIVARLNETAARAGIGSLMLDADAPAPKLVSRVGHDVIEAFFRFETQIGRGRGVVRIAATAGEDSQPRAWTVLTALEELKSFQEKTGSNRPTGQSHSRDFRGPNWLDQRQAAEAYDDHDPTVLVIGGGQAGLAAAARLTQLGVDTLIIDKHARIGDNWRKRYHALTLHNQVQVNHLPYMPYPPTWPTYIPKDKLANWFEAYVEALELNYWTSTELVEGSYDEYAKVWLVTLRRSDGTTRAMKPRHIVMATGVSGIPNVPELPGLDSFSGQVVHSSAYEDGEDWSGKSAIVIGTGNSGHDISQDLSSSGAHVTLVQRSPTLVVNIEPSAQLPYTLYAEGPALEDCDLITVSMPTPLVRKAHVGYTEKSRELDQDLLNGLEKIGFKLDFGEDGTGWQFKYLTRGGGYYFNVGCSDMLVDGTINLSQYDDIETFNEHGALMKDGTTKPADLIVLSTGYKPQEVLVEKLFGAEVRERIGPIWGFGEQLELRNMYCRTGQPGLWFIAGSLAQCRINSKYLALQIKACEEGIIPLTKD
ncbi:MAG: NAD(P)/FAD-dependent oxidoreductase [Pseudomonadota bacterium]